MARSGRALGPAAALEAARERIADLERSNAELGRFAELAAHELSEPLRKIRAMARFLAPGASAGADEAAGYAARMGDAAARMDRLLKALLDLARPAGNEGPLGPIALDEVLADASGEFTPGEGSLVLEPLPTVRGDRDQLVLLFRCLLSNALKFRRAGVPSKVEVACAGTSARSVDIAVTDNGIGFDAAHAQRIFEPFERLNKRTEFRGAGLGLTLCARIAQRHGGSVSARSEPGLGSVFVVTLPSIEAEQWVES